MPLLSISSMVQRSSRMERSEAHRRDDSRHSLCVRSSRLRQRVSCGCRQRRREGRRVVAGDDENVGQRIQRERMRSSPEERLDVLRKWRRAARTQQRSTHLKHRGQAGRAIDSGITMGHPEWGLTPWPAKDPIPVGRNVLETHQGHILRTKFKQPLFNPTPRDTGGPATPWMGPVSMYL